MKKPSPISRSTPYNEGFSLPIALLAGFLLLLGSLALASRSGWGLFGSAFQNKNWAARSAAETGMNTIVSELNRPQNRWLNVVRRNNQGAQDPDYQNEDSSGDLWKNRSTTTNILELRQNPCIVTQSPPSSNEIPDYSGLDPSSASSTSYEKWYINNDGTISAAQGTASKSFRLSKIIRQPYAGNIDRNDVNEDGLYDENDRYLSVWRDRSTNPSGVGKVTIQVEGQSYQNGEVIASVILERTYELTPKCCGVPFGGKHGNVDYAVQSSGSTVCLTQLGLGLLAGADGTDTGSITIQGRGTDIKDESLVQDVNPIYCLASNQAGCAINNNDPDISVAIVDTQLPPAFTFCSPPGGVGIYPTNPCASGSTPASGYFADGTKLDDGTTLVTDRCGSGSFKTQCGSGNSQTVVYDFSAPTLPNYCIRASNNEVHCNIGGAPLTAGSAANANISFITGSAKVRLYFANGGPVIGSTGNTTLSNCTSVSPAGECAPSTRITDLSLFGSNANTSPVQTISLQGTPNASNLFIYFPTATVNLTGNANFSGVLWTNNLTSTGNPTWIIPSSGITEVFELMGLTSGRAGEIEPLFYDFVLRSTNQQRWLGG